MPVMFMISTILLIICSLSAGIMGTPRLHGHKTNNNVRITLFNDTSCGHDHIVEELGYNLNYGYLMSSPFTIQSYTLSRDLTLAEQLDWYAGGTGAGKCGDFLQITSPDSNNNALHKGTCYLIVGEAAVCNTLGKGILNQETNAFHPVRGYRGTAEVTSSNFCLLHMSSLLDMADIAGIVTNEKRE